MKKLLLPISFLLTVFTGCIKNTPAINSDSKVEFDAATWNANAAGVTYPIFSQIPVYGAVTIPAPITTPPTPPTTPLLTRTLATFQIRVNLLGTQKSTATTFNYRVVSGETTATAGVHYTPLSGTGTIPANSSYGYIDIALLNSGVSSTTPVILVLEILSNDIVTSNTNYAKVGFRIAQL